MLDSALQLLDRGSQVDVSANGKTVWVHASDGCTVGRFSKVFGMDVHTGFEAQLSGAPQCLHCTHETPSAQQWLQFCALMREHHGIEVDTSLLDFEGAR